MGDLASVAPVGEPVLIAGRRCIALLGADPAGAYWLQIHDIEWDWVLAYRLEGQEGSPVVAELRVFPGPFSGVIGCAAVAELPPGGLTRRALRDNLAIGESLALLPRLASTASRFDGLIAGLPAGLAAAGIDIEEPSGGRGKPELWFARLALDYVTAIRSDPRRPIEVLRASPRYEGYSMAALRDYVHRSRRKKLLTAGPGPGRAGGSLTPRAEQILSAKTMKGMR